MVGLRTGREIQRGYTVYRTEARPTEGHTGSSGSYGTEYIMAVTVKEDCVLNLVTKFTMS